MERICIARAEIRTSGQERKRDAPRREKAVEPQHGVVEVPELRSNVSADENLLLCGSCCTPFGGEMHSPGVVEPEAPYRIRQPLFRTVGLNLLSFY
jgi:hypothetical protein